MINQAFDVEASTYRVRRRYWQRAEEVLLPWWPGGLLPILALVALFLWGVLWTAPRIQTQVRDAVASELEQADIELSSVETDGQNVRVAAIGRASEAPAIRAIATSTQCGTWAGDLTCPSGVALSLAEPAPPPQVEPTLARSHDFVASVDAQRGVTLAGEAPNETARRRAIDLAESRFELVVDRLRVSDEAASPQYGGAMDRALNLLTELTQGEARWRGGRLSVSGLASRADEQAIRSAFTPADDGVALGDLALTLIDDNVTCNQSIDELLQTASINFASGSAVIAKESSALLEQLAVLTRQCAGVILVEGHTDNTGSAAGNVILSEQRASAVGERLVDLGVPEDAIQTRGFGAGRPIADNSTPAGRKTNRRIVIKAIEQSETEKES